MVLSNLENELKDVLGANYDYATAVVAYAESKSLEYNYIGMAEFRDALTHIKRILFTDDVGLASTELSFASEHIRRAAVESMQDYVETKFKDIRDRAYTPWPRYFLSRYKKQNMKEFKEKEILIIDYIYQARKAKPHKEWKEAICYFQKAEELLFELDRNIPTKNQLNFSNSEIILNILYFVLGAGIVYAIL